MIDELKSIGKQNVSESVSIIPTHYKKTEDRLQELKMVINSFPQFMTKEINVIDKDKTKPTVPYQFTPKGQIEFAFYETEIGMAVHYIVDAEIDIRTKMFRESNMINQPPMPQVPMNVEPVGRFEKLTKILKKESKIENKPDAQMQPLFMSMVEARKRWYNICSQYADACNTRNDDYDGYLKDRNFMLVSYKKYVNPILLWCIQYSISKELDKSRTENKDMVIAHIEEKKQLEKNMFQQFPQ